jgi:hypothetical protein
MFGDAMLVHRNFKMSIVECFIREKIIAKGNLFASFVISSLNIERMNTNIK